MLDIIDEPDEKASEAAPATSPRAAAPVVESVPPAPSAAVAAEEVGSDGGDSAAGDGSDDESGWVEVHHSKAVSTKPSKSSRRRRNRAARAVATADPDAATAAAANASESAFITKADREDDGEGEWFGPGSSGAATPFDAGVTVEGVPRSPVGCITTDFAMQVRMAFYSTVYFLHFPSHVARSHNCCVLAAVFSA